MEERKKEKTEKQKLAWQKCQEARLKSINARKAEKARKHEETYITEEINEVMGPAPIEIVQEKLNEIREKKTEHIDRIARIWEEVRRAKLEQNA
jgi:hypothetical protein